MWYSSKSRNEKADRPSKVKNIVSYPDDHGEHIDGMLILETSTEIRKIFAK